MNTLPDFIRREIEKATSRASKIEVREERETTTVVFTHRLRCPHHPRYRGLRRPRVECVGCAEVYADQHSSRPPVPQGPAASGKHAESARAPKAKGSNSGRRDAAGANRHP